MTPLRILAAATAIELCFAVAAAAVVGLWGAMGGWSDMVNCAAPLLLVLAITGAVSPRLMLKAGLFRTCCVSLALVAALFNVVLVAPDLVSLATASRPTQGLAYRVVTANLYHDNYIPAHAAAAIIARRADAVMVQETDGPVMEAIGLLQKAYPYSTNCPEANVQILVKTKVLAQGCGLYVPAAGWKTWGKSFAWLRTAGPDGRPITLAVVHFGRPYPLQQQAMERRALSEALRHFTPQDETILAGDFNTAPYTFAMFAQDRVLAPLHRLTFWQPTFPALLLHQRWDFPLLPIDHMYAGARWRAAAVTGFRVNGSDHRGLQADLRLAP